MIFMTQKLMNKIAEKFSTEGAVNDEKEMFDVNVRSVLYGTHSFITVGVKKSTKDLHDIKLKILFILYSFPENGIDFYTTNRYSKF